MSQAGNADLVDFLSREIRRTGPMTFDRFMDHALTHPQWGYYRADGRPVFGRSGDFLTSVSVGPCFGSLLGEWLGQEWVRLGRPAEFLVIEPGANDGRLGEDIASHLQKTRSEIAEALRYVVVEAVPDLGAAAVRRIESAGIRAESRPSVAGARFPAGALIANEFLDALPVRRIRRTSGSWRELAVSVGADGFAWTPVPAPEAVLGEIDDELGSGPWPEGYETEVHPAARRWVAEVASIFEQGSFLIIDYGFDRETYYQRERMRGTLRTYARHGAGASPLAAPGNQDITAHVNFSLVRSAAASAGLTLVEEEPQFRFLTRLARPILRTMDGRPAGEAERRWLRQFQQLTYPGNFGGAFRVLEFRKGEER